MKNLFYIHSHITYFVSKAIIEKYRYSRDSIVLVRSRGYENIETQLYKTIDITEIHDELDSFGPTNFWSKHKYIKKLDDLIFGEIGEQNFRAYLPHVFHPAMQIIASNVACKQLHIIEEGVNAYSEYLMHQKEVGILKPWIKKLLNALPFVGKKRIFFIKNFDLRKFKKNTASIFYSVTDKGFKGISNTVKILKMQPIAGLEYNTYGRPVLIFEGAVEQGNMKFSTMQVGIEKILKNLNTDIVYMKFHPVQSANNRKKIETLIKNHNFDIEVIPDTIPFEQIILTNPNVEVHGFTSSLLFYAHAYGCNVFSYEEELPNDGLFKRFRSKNNFNLKALIRE